MNEQIPHFSTVSYNFKHRYTEKTIEDIFYWILNEIETAGYLSPEAVFAEGTHIKANANLKKDVKGNGMEIRECLYWGRFSQCQNRSHELHLKGRGCGVIYNDFLIVLIIP